MQHKRSGIIWMLISASAYSMFTIFGKNVLKELSAVDVVFWRFMIAAPVAWIIVLAQQLRGGPRIFSVAWKPRFLAGFAFGAMAWMAFAGLERLPGALYIVIIYTYPAMVAVGSSLLGKPTPNRVWIAVGITLLGVALTVPQIFDGTNGASILGLVFTFGNALLYACYVIFSERLVLGESTAQGLLTSAWSLTGSLFFALLVALISWPIHGPANAHTAWSLVGLAVISTVVASMAFFLGVKHLGPPVAALIASTEPVLTLIWVIMILHESLKLIQIIGAALVIFGVFWSQRPTRNTITSQVIKA